MDPLIHRQIFKIRGYDVDLTMHASILATIRLMHDAAVDQVIELGFSALQLMPRNLGWVLTQQYLEIFERPKLGDQVEIVTYPSGIEKAFTYRDYYMYSDQKKLLAQATTSWILMDISSRKISAYPEDIQKILHDTADLDHLPRAPHFSPSKEKSNWQKSFYSSYFELDFNGHISNHYFYKWMLDAVPMDFLFRHKLIQFNVKFKGEAFAGDKVIAEVVMDRDLTVHHQLIKDDECIATGISHWQSIPQES